MNRKLYWYQTILSVAMIAAGIFFLFSGHVRGDSNCVALAAELHHSQSAQSSQSSDVLPTFENAKTESRALSGSLSDEISRWAKSSTDPRWLGYSVPAISRDRVICCGGNGDWNGNSGCGTCRLEGRRYDTNFTSTSSSKTMLEGTSNVVVLYRASAGALGKIRIVSDSCVIDAGGLQVTWLTGVNSAQSVETLSGFVRGQNLRDGGPEHLAQGALTAIAMHGDSSADKALNAFVEPSQPESLRKQTVFWLGEARGVSGLQTLKRIDRSDPSNEVRAQITFALSLNHEPGALDEMIRMAREDESSHVRGQALFWLAHKAGEKAASTITGAIENDPDTEVKKKAVFALSQMPHEEGVPKLIQVAQNNKNPEVRKQAMFWLGQTNDPRALEFFEKILTK